MDKNKKNSNIKTVLFVILGAVLGVIISFFLIKYTKLSEMLELTKNLQKYQNGLVNVIVRAKRDIYTSDLLSIDIEFEKI